MALLQGIYREPLFALVYMLLNVNLKFSCSMIQTSIIAVCSGL